MSEQVRKIKIFVASPGDVVKEREGLKDVVEELNTTIAPYKGLALDLVKWETHATPDMGRAQGVINNQLDEYDIFIGLMWKRFGTPTGKAESGTEEEFRIAYDQWEKTKSVRILFYFCQTPFMPRTTEEIRQLQKVVEFREELAHLGLTWEYQDSSQFPNVVRPHLARILLDTPSSAQSQPLSVNILEQVSMSDRMEATIVRKKARVFISSSKEDLPLVIQLADFLREIGLQPIRWDEDVFSPGRTIIEAFESMLSDVDAAIVILGKPDETAHYKQNLVFELGMLQGMIGRAKTIVITTVGTAKLPSDLLGMIYLQYSGEIATVRKHLAREFAHMGILPSDP